MIPRPSITYSTSPNCGSPAEFEIDGRGAYRYWQLVNVLMDEYGMSENDAQDYIRECERAL